LLNGRNIALCVTGSIAAYKAALLARLLVGEGAVVSVVMTQSAEQLIGPATFGGITNRAVHSQLFTGVGEPHVELAQQSDLVVVFPATADSLARFAQGRANDLVTALVLSATCPVLVAPAMHPSMWSHPATQRNVRTLATDGRVQLIGPVDGEVASGERGMGRMVEAETMLSAIKAALAPKDLKHKRLVITAGPTFEDIDPVRFIANRSTGKMGFALAERAVWRGALVTLISGPTALPTPTGACRTDVRSAEEMRTHLWGALHEDLQGADALLMAAAVADHRPRTQSPTKLKRSGGATALELTANPDLLAEVGNRRKGRRPALIGFAVETGTDEEVARWASEKLAYKKVDLVVANPGAEALGRDDNRAQLISNGGSERLQRLNKSDLADRILDELVRLLAAD
jgi:phosphopantothenoylcysteine decarboxylase/phosphopantothenate--cysteine ligase